MARTSKKTVKTATSKRYTHYDVRAQEQLANVVNYLLDEYGKISMDWLGNLDQLALNYHLMFLAADALETDGLIVTSRLGDPMRNPAHKILVDAQTAINRLTKELGISPLSHARIAKNETESETVAQQKLLDSILN